MSESAGGVGGLFCGGVAVFNVEIWEMPVMVNVMCRSVISFNLVYIIASFLNLGCVIFSDPQCHIHLMYIPPMAGQAPSYAQRG